MALTTYPSLLLTGGAANTKGAYVEIVASTPYASSRLHLIFHSSSAQNRIYLVDIASGGSGSETVVIANLAAHTDGGVVVGDSVTIDVDIPAGTRLAARCQCVTGSSAIVLSVLLEDRALGSLANPVTYGADTTNSRGTQIDPGTTVNTKGNYVQLSASTSARIDAVVLCWTVAGQGVGITAYTWWHADLATGAGGAEMVVIGNVRIDTGSTTDMARPMLVRLPVSIPAGTRLAVRCECNRNTASERLLCVTLIGMQEPAAGGSTAAAVAFVG